jgi:hypothetical protein
MCCKRGRSNRKVRRVVSVWFTLSYNLLYPECYGKSGWPYTWIDWWPDEHVYARPWPDEHTHSSFKDHFVNTNRRELFVS